MEQIPWAEIMQRLDTIGVTLTEGAKSAVEFVYPLAIREVIVAGSARVSIGGLLLIFGILAACAGVRCVGKWEGAKLYSDEKDRYDMYASTSFFFGIFGVVIGAAFLWFSVPLLLNPKWHALMKLADLVK